MEKEKIVSIEDRIPKLKETRKKKANRRLIFYLSIFFLLISIIIYLQSPWSDIKHIHVNGNTFLSQKEILSEGELSTDTNIWMLNKKNIIQKIVEHPVVKDVEITRQFPQTVNVSVKEHQIIGYVQEDNLYQPILENGSILTTEQSRNKGDGPLFVNFTDESYFQRMLEELNEVPTDISNLISEISWEPTDKNKYKIVLYMNDGFIVQATIRNFASKMKTYPSVVSQLNEGEKGIVHMGVGTYFEKFPE